LTRWAALTAELAKITQPALVASGHRDIMAPAINSYILARHIPDAQLITYPDSGTASWSSTQPVRGPRRPLPRHRRRLRLNLPASGQTTPPGRCGSGQKRSRT
jgi:hypothetical protein